MNKRSRNSKEFSRRLLALLLCCFCLVTLIPVTAAAENGADDAVIPAAAADGYTETEPTEPPAEPETEAAPALEPTPEPEVTTKPETTVEPTVEPTANPAAEPTVAPTTEPETTPEPTPEPTAEAPVKSETDVLFERLMAYASFEELDAALNALTANEQALLEQLTAEQNAALEARVKELGGYAIDVLVSYGVTIADTIATNGLLTVSATDPALTGSNITYIWEKSTDNTTWTEVTRTKVTGDLWNMAEDGSWINVALDKGARCYYRAKIATVDGAAVDANNQVYSASTQVTYYDALQNGSFETPVVTSDGAEGFITGGSNGIVWQTTDTKNEIELLRPANSRSGSVQWHGVINAAEREQCAEINANGAGALYQDVLTVPGSTMHWQFSHLGRSMNGSPVGAPESNGTGQIQTDTMYVLIMPYDKAKDITTQEKVLEAVNTPPAGAQVRTYTYTWRWAKNGSTYTMQHRVNNNWVAIFTCNSDGSNYKQLKDPWEVHGDTYIVPENQYLTRYFFASGSTASGNASVGNHIDNVWFSTAVPPATPGKANLTIQKTLNVEGWDNLSDEQKTAFRSSVSFAYTTPNGKKTTVSGAQMDWNDNVGTYSEANITLGNNNKITVAETVGAAPANYVWQGQETDKTKTVTLVEKQTATAEFTNTYTLIRKDLTIRKTVTGNMQDPNKEFAFTVTADKAMTFGGQTGTTFNFNLKKDGQVTITVPVTAYVTVTENADGYEYTVGSGTTITGYTKLDNGIEFTMPNADDTIVVFNNEKNVKVDTGVALDSLPYVLILAVVAVGAVVLLKKRRMRED